MPIAKQPKEQTHNYMVFKEFGSVNTQPSRTALKENEFAWLENVMPIGDGYAPAVAAVGTAIATIVANVSFMHPLTLGTTNYMVWFDTNGGCEAVNLGTGAVVTVAPSSTFTNAVMDQWKSERAVIVDPSKGYFSWDGTLLYAPGSLATISVAIGGSGFTSVPSISFSGGGGSNATATASILSGALSAITITAVGSGFTAAPTVTISGGGGSGASATAQIMATGQVGTTIATYSGRVWLGNVRTLTYTAPGTWWDFNTADASGSTTLTEGFLREAIYGLEALDNYLYVFGDSSIYIIGDLKVTGSITTFTLTNLSSTTGTTLPNTITSMERAILFMNKYGVYATFGASVQKISQALDGVFPKIDFSQTVSGGLATIYNILCYVVNFTYQDPTAGNRPLQAVFFNNKWFFTSQHSQVDFISPANVNGDINLYLAHTTHFHRCFQDTTSAISTTFKTALVPLESPILDKQFNRYGVEITCPNITTITVAIQTEVGTNTTTAVGVSYAIWQNTSLQNVAWTNTSTATVLWVNTGFILTQDYADIVGKYLGFTITSNNPQIVINGALAEYQPRAPW